MIRLVPPLFALLLTGCHNYGNSYMPQGERNPHIGPDPNRFPQSVDVNREITRHSLQLNVAPGAALRLRVACSGGSIRAFVNARAVGEGCPLDAAIPDGTLVAGTATLVELEADVPVRVGRVAIGK